MQLEASWKVIGCVTETRELKSEKNATWRGYVCKVATYGLSAEINLTADQFKRVGVGERLAFRGRFEEQSGRLKLMAEGIEAAKAGA